MTVPSPKDCRFDSERDGVAFTADVAGQPVKCFITTRALEDYFPHARTPDEKVRMVASLTMLTLRARKCVADGEPVPITFTTRDF